MEARTSNPPKLAGNRDIGYGYDVVKEMVDNWNEKDINSRLLDGNRASYFKENDMAIFQFEALRNSIQNRKLESTTLAEDTYLGQIKSTAKVLHEKDTSNVGATRYQVIAASRPLTTAKYMAHFRREIDVL